MLSYIIQDLWVPQKTHASLFHDNQAALYIAVNLIFHEHTNIIKIDFHIIRDKLHVGMIHPSYMPIDFQLSSIFTKILGKEQFEKLRDKLNIHNIHFLTWEWILRIL